MDAAPLRRPHVVVGGILAAVVSVVTGALLSAIAVQALLQPSLTSVVLAIGFISWMEVTRVVRAQLLTLRERGYVRAALTRVLAQHILPAAPAPISTNSPPASTSPCRRR